MRRGGKGDAIPLIAFHNAPLFKAGFFTHRLNIKCGMGCSRKTTSQKEISLNLEERKKERDDDEEKRLEILNERRQAAGLKLLKKGEVEPKEDKLDDPQLKESANILADLILLTTK